MNSFSNAAVEIQALEARCLLSIPATPPLAADSYEAAVYEAKAVPTPDWGDMADYITRHEGTVLFVYPDSVGIPTVGVGYNLQKSTPAAVRAEVDGALGAGTYDKMMASWQRTRGAWEAKYGDFQGFKYGTKRWKEFAAANRSAKVLTPVLTTTTAKTLLETILPKYVYEAKKHVGGAAYEALPHYAKVGVVDIAYQRGGKGLSTMTAMLAALRQGDVLGAAWGMMNAPPIASGDYKGQLYANAFVRRARDNFRAFAWASEDDVASYRRFFVHGHVYNESTGAGIAAAGVLVARSGGSLKATTRADGWYLLSLPRDLRDQTSAVILQAYKKGFVCKAEPLDLGEDDQYLDVELEPLVRGLISVETSLHHLGDSNFRTPLNAGLQLLAAEGTQFNRAFTLTAAQLTGFSSAELEITINGAEVSDPVFINGANIAAMNNSTAGPEIMLYDFDISLLKAGTNYFGVRSALDYDYDDFEFSNVLIRLS